MLPTLTWVSGSATPGALGAYGTRGVPAPGNMPGARETLGSAQWIDSSGNFWLFGGYGRTYVAGEGALDDLWRFDGTTWTWMAGSDESGSTVVYGALGASDPATTPGPRPGAAYWRDSSDNLWLFGGLVSFFPSATVFGDLWHFDGTNWVWSGGSSSTNSPGDPGTQAVPAASNTPRARTGAMTCVDASGTFWMFGGSSYSDATYNSSELGDLWKFQDGQWTWMGGSTDENAASVFGTTGVSDPANRPAGRVGGILWAGNDGSIWLFGGMRYSEETMGRPLEYLNDLWRFKDGEWTWIHGSSGANANGTYGMRGVSAPANTPGARGDFNAWPRADGTLWLFGGSGLGASGNTEVLLNDLWYFDGNAWTWMAGSDAGESPSVHGERGVPAMANTPGARWKAAAWSDAVGNLWLFGGMDLDSESPSGDTNELWRFDSEGWTWMSGSSDSRNDPGSYGIQGVADSENRPLVRYSPLSWVDAAGDAWIFGGSGASYSGALGTNDLWRIVMHP